MPMELGHFPVEVVQVPMDLGHVPVELVLVPMELGHFPVELVLVPRSQLLGTLAQEHGTLAQEHGTLAQEHGTLAQEHGTLDQLLEPLAQPQQSWGARLPGDLRPALEEAYGQRPRRRPRPRSTVRALAPPRTPRRARVGESAARRGGRRVRGAHVSGARPHGEMNPAPAVANEINLSSSPRQMPRRRILFSCAVALSSLEERQRRALGRHTAFCAAAGGSQGVLFASSDPASPSLAGAPASSSSTTCRGVGTALGCCE